MLKPYAFANAFTAVGLGLYVVCRLLSLIAPDLLFAVAQSWFHTISMSSLKTVEPFGLGTFLLGAVSMSILIWLTAYGGALLYNKLSR